MTQLFSLVLLLGILWVLPSPATAQAPAGAALIWLGEIALPRRDIQKAEGYTQRAEIDKLLDELPR